MNILNGIEISTLHNRTHSKCTCRCAFKVIWYTVCGGQTVVGGDLGLLVVSWILVHSVAGGDRGFWMACLCFIYIDIYVSAGVPLRKDEQED